MSLKSKLPKYVRWHQGVLRYQRPDLFEGRSKAIRQAPGTPGFWRAYAALEAGQLPEGHVERPPKKLPGKAARGAAGTLQWGIELYLLDADRDDRFIARVRAKKVKIFDAFAAAIAPTDPTKTRRGQWLIADFEPSNIKAYLAECERTGGVGRYNLHFDALKPLFEWFTKTEFDGKRLLDKLNPCHGMQRKPYRHEDGPHKGRKRVPFAWRPQHFEAFRARWPVGAADAEWHGKPRLVVEMAEALWIRRTDIARLGPDHLQRDADGELVWEFAEFKGARHDDPKQHRVKAALVPELMEALDGYLKAYKRHPVQSLDAKKVLLTYTGNGPNKGKTMTGRREVAYFIGDDARWLNKHFRIWCNEAGLPKQCTLHGIRRGMAVETTHAGEDINAIRAKLGHRKVEQTMIYLRTQIDTQLTQGLMERDRARKAARALKKAGKPGLRVVA